MRKELFAERQPAEAQEDPQQAVELHVRNLSEAVRHGALLYGAQADARLGKGGGKWRRQRSEPANVGAAEGCIAVTFGEGGTGKRTP